ncbi:MAG: type II toxin-antitoxin system RelE/ParE family toxin [Burkholderiaceae bacterium]
MSARYRVVPTVTFQEDIERLEEHIVQRELASNTPDDTCLFRFRDAVERAMTILSFAPHTCRRCEKQREFRELIIPFGHGGCVALFAIREPDVLLLAARDQHGHDYR